MTAAQSARGPRYVERTAEEGLQATTGGFAIVIGRLRGTVVVTLRGTLDTLAAARLAPALEDLIEGQGNLRVAIDLRRLQDAGPSGVQALAAAASSLERRGGALRLSQPNDRILQSLDKAGLSRFIGDPPRLESRSSPGNRRRDASSATWAAPADRAARAGHPAGTGRTSPGTHR
ncbi:MAG: STAS domain-containing protein [Acidimicrobiales bacterium]